ncbi:MAG: hypothetical protein ACLT31_10525 [Lachnospiraceae bacterium]
MKRNRLSLWLRMKNSAEYQLPDAAAPLATKSALRRQSPKSIISSKTAAGSFILDIMLPDGNGLDICRHFREKTMNPVLSLRKK